MPSRPRSGTRSTARPSRSSGRAAASSSTGADNNNAPFIEGGYNAAKLVSDYKADLAALGSKTSPISNVFWITPNPDTGYPPSPGNGSTKAWSPWRLALPN